MNTTTKTLWKVDPTHSEIQFKVKHLVISTVTGQFETFDATLETEGDSFEGAKITFSADINSINTKNADRDGHLKSDDFFNAEKFPQMTFASTKFEKVGEGEFRLTGDLTIRDVTKEVVLNVDFGGVVVDPYGQTKAGFELTGSINRKEYNLSWSAVTEAGNVVVSDQVKLLLNVQLVKS